jgi:hypothetical protein
LKIEKKIEIIFASQSGPHIEKIHEVKIKAKKSLAAVPFILPFICSLAKSIEKMTLGKV